MKRFFLNNFAPVLLVLVLIFIDQASKFWAKTTLIASDISIIDGVLSLHYLKNTGAAFSILEGKMTFFYIITPVICLWIIVIFKRLQRMRHCKGLQILLLFVVAGAVGNYIDRLTYQYVHDFIYFSLINFPVFNIADIYVTIAVFVLLLLFVFAYSEEDVDKIYCAAKFWKRID